MKQEYIDFLKDVKKQFKTNNYKVIGNVHDTENNLYELITKYVLYLWYKDTNDDRMDNNGIWIPLDQENRILFSDIDFLDIAKILAYIKYDLLNDITDSLNINNVDKKKLNKFTFKKLKSFVENSSLPNSQLSKKIHYITFIINNKEAIFTTQSQQNNEEIEEITESDEEDTPNYTYSQLLKITIKKLKQICRNHNITKYSRLRKIPLILYILESLNLNQPIIKRKIIKRKIIKRKITK